MDNKEKKIKILLVDNDEMMSIYFRDIFWVHGHNNRYDISVAPSLSEARKKITEETTRPDIIFLDAMIPTEGGNSNSESHIKESLAFIKEIKSHSELSKINIVIYSGHIHKSLEKEAYSLGINGYIIKGEFTPKEIITYTDKLHGSNN